MTKPLFHYFEKYKIPGCVLVFSDSM